jgi:hypothetical protein
MPFIGWYLDPRRYSTPDYLNTWKLPPNNAAPATSTPTAVQPAH